MKCLPPTNTFPLALSEILKEVTTVQPNVTMTFCDLFL